MQEGQKKQQNNENDSFVFVDLCGAPGGFSSRVGTSLITKLWEKEGGDRGREVSLSLSLPVVHLGLGKFIKERFDKDTKDDDITLNQPHHGARLSVTARR